MTLLPLGCFIAAPSPPLLLCSAVCRELLLPSPRTSFLVLWPAGRRPVSVVETEPRYFYLRSPVGVSPLSSAPLLSLLPASSHSSTLVVAPAAPASGFQKPELSFPPSMFLYPQYLFRFLNFCFWVLDSDSPASASKFWDYRQKSSYRARNVSFFLKGSMKNILLTSHYKEKLCYFLNTWIAIHQNIREMFLLFFTLVYVLWYFCQ